MPYHRLPVLSLSLQNIVRKLTEPSHEITVLFVLRKLILQTPMHSHPPVGLDVWFFIRPFVYFYTLCVRTAKALARLRGCADSPEPSLVAYVISTIISWAGSVILLASWYWCLNEHAFRITSNFEGQDAAKSWFRTGKYNRKMVGFICWLMHWWVRRLPRGPSNSFLLMNHSKA